MEILEGMKSRSDTQGLQVDGTLERDNSLH
jgi:hypothetical protein